MTNETNLVDPALFIKEPMSAYYSKANDYLSGKNFSWRGDATFIMSMYQRIKD